MVPKPSVKPSPYPSLAFHITRSCQLVSSLIVAGIMFYFLKELKHDHYRLPWTFILLLATSLLTLIFLGTTTLLSLFHTHTPLLNLSLNALLTLLWTLSFALLTWWSSGTLGHICNRLNWETSAGISVCRTYKALFSFALLGWLSTCLALGLDVRVWRREGQRGKFVALGREEREMKRAFEEEEEDEGVEMNPNPTARGKKPRGGEGYEVPEEQWRYEDDISYQGAAGQVERRSLEERL